ncbi:hypothetical protein KR51_00025840 [Rubidibacter lacunae KORDI 51-2]|uniref:DUF4126 domain-containing protein n=1 Tax=Rubidibacter lacunae KORDI 51-2 TaxID=582515 RepID=U5D8C8_9CHRO|nr:DUF4126 domain-containing protein [Rubidibacter lacunae]ERN40873.1 hypothetical protein KR51_00025840 [Rubidibacter lacunae KORDI 51-2]
MGMETLVAVCLGIGMSAACGFRVFLPLLVLNLVARFGEVGVAPGLDWLSGEPATIVLAIATTAEVLGFYIPVIDNLLGVLEAPAAIIAGTLVSASVLGDLHPALQWGAAIVAGGGTAGIVEGATVATRAASTGLTGGLANPVVSTLELLSALVLSLLALLVPVLAVITLIVALVLSIRYLRKIFRRRHDRPPAIPS